MASDPSRPTADLVADVLEEVERLRDLFQRRLMDDKVKAKLYDALHEQLAIARAELSDQHLAPLFRELLMVVDRVQGLARNGDRELKSVADELLEILERQAVLPVPSKTAFDGSWDLSVG